MNSFVLTMEKTPERLIMFHSQGIPATPVYSAPDKNPVRSFNRGYVAMLQTFYGTREEKGLLLEDDAVIENLERLRIAMRELGHFDLMYLGGNMCHWVPGIDKHPPQRTRKHSVRIFRALTTHAIVWTREAAKNVLESFDPDGEESFDLWLCLHFLQFNHCYMVTPTIAKQRPGFSGLELKQTDHSNSFEETDKLCRSAQRVYS